MSDLSDKQIQKLIDALKSAKGSEVETKSGFLKFLKNIGMHSLAQKLANSPMWNQVWDAIQGFLETIANAVDWAVETVEDAFDSIGDFFEDLIE